MRWSDAHHREGMPAFSPATRCGRGDKQKRGHMAGFFEVYVESNFSAAHRLIGYPGDCASMHGHNWTVRLFVSCERLGETGLAIDFRDIKRALEKVLTDFDHTTLNDLPAFHTINPTAENIAKFLYGAMQKNIDRDGVRVSAVMVAETPDAGVFYRGGGCP